VAYGARLESVLGASPQGFESPILRTCDPRALKGSRPHFRPVTHDLRVVAYRPRPRRVLGGRSIKIAESGASCVPYLGSSPTIRVLTS
jgi:hypothetical protein